MKMLKLSPYYYPEQISSSHLTKDLEEAYVNEGFEIVVHAPTPTRGINQSVYNKYKHIKREEFKNGKVVVHRFAMFREKNNLIQRATRYILVNFLQYIKGCKEKEVSIVYGGSTPPTQGVLCGKVAAKLSKKQGKKVPFIYNLQDVFPDSLISAGMTRKDSFLYKIGRKIEDITYRYADKIIVISEDIKKNIMNKGVPEDKIEVIYNWIDTEKVKQINMRDNQLAKELEIRDEKFRVVYAGTLGLMQGIDTLIHVAEELKDNQEIEFLIFGNGTEEKKLKEMANNLKNIRFFPLQPIERVSEVYSLGNCCVVLCRKGIGCTGVPSKTWSIMACGRPVLVGFDRGELTQTIEYAEAGLCSEAENISELKENILKLSNNKELCQKMGEKARNYAVLNVDKKVIVDKYIRVLRKILMR